MKSYKVVESGAPLEEQETERPIPKGKQVLVKTIALDFTNLQTLKANSISLISSFEGLFLVTNFKSFLLNIILSLSCRRNEPLNNFITELFFSLKLAYLELCQYSLEHLMNGLF